MAARRPVSRTPVSGFARSTVTEIDAYIATGEPMDKAGAYGIQGYGATIVERVDGDFFTVVVVASWFASLDYWPRSGSRTISANYGTHPQGRIVRSFRTTMFTLALLAALLQPPVDTFVGRLISSFESGVTVVPRS